MSLALLMTFSTYDPFNKSVPPVHSLVHADLGHKPALDVIYVCVCVCALEFLILAGRNIIS